jgi:small subunit ribosomal protein S17
LLKGRKTGSKENNQKMKKTILGVNAPEKECTDSKCPFHGELNVKDELFQGKVVKKDINHSATIQWERSIYIKKYERYAVKRSRMRVHNPPCIDAKIDQFVLVARTRPVSKTKNHVILTVINKEQDVKEIKK